LTHVGGDFRQLALGALEERVWRMGKSYGRRGIVATAGAVASRRDLQRVSRAELLVSSPMPAPEWALLQRELLRAHTEGLRNLPRQVLRRAITFCASRAGVPTTDPTMPSST
jgi:hypothetical protein